MPPQAESIAKPSPQEEEERRLRIQQESENFINSSHREAEGRNLADKQLTYTSVAGHTYEGKSLKEAMERCPFLGKISMQQAEVLVEAYNHGMDLINNRQKVVDGLLGHDDKEATSKANLIDNLFALVQNEKQASAPSTGPEKPVVHQEDQTASASTTKETANQLAIHKQEEVKAGFKQEFAEGSLKQAIAEPDLRRMRAETAAPTQREIVDLPNLPHPQEISLLEKADPGIQPVVLLHHEGQIIDPQPLQQTISRESPADVVLSGPTPPDKYRTSTTEIIPEAPIDVNDVTNEEGQPKVPEPDERQTETVFLPFEDVIEEPTEAEMTYKSIEQEDMTLQAAEAVLEIDTTDNTLSESNLHEPDQLDDSSEDSQIVLQPTETEIDHSEEQPVPVSQDAAQKTPIQPKSVAERAKNTTERIEAIVIQSLENIVDDLTVIESPIIKGSVEIINVIAAEVERVSDLAEKGTLQIEEGISETIEPLFEQLLESLNIKLDKEEIRTYINELDSGKIELLKEKIENLNLEHLGTREVKQSLHQLAVSADYPLSKLRQLGRAVLSYFSQTEAAA